MGKSIELLMWQNIIIVKLVEIKQIAIVAGDEGLVSQSTNINMANW